MFRLRSLYALPVAASLVVAAPACKPTDPNDPQTWISQLADKDQKKVTDAARELRKLKAKESVAALVPLLKHESGDVREEAAYALMEIGDASAVQPLIDAIDLGAGGKGADRANRKIAEALGALGDKKATPTLLKMVQGSKTDIERLAAVDALGQLKDTAAAKTLIRLVEDGQTAPLITKRAIIALGNMRAQESIPALTKAMVIERRGVSFFVEASYALFQIGAPSAVAVSAILTGDDKSFATWAEENNRAAAGYLSKGAIVLADLGDKSAVPSLVKLASWQDPNGNDVFQMLVRGTAAEALGRLRAAEGAKVIADQVAIDEANIREKFAIALAHIGDKSALPKLEAAAKKGTWSARSSAITGLALLGDGRHKGVIEAAIQEQTPDNAVKNCLTEEASDGEPAALREARCERQRTERPKFLQEELGRLLAAEACGADLQCWQGKLKDTNPKVRERAAYELGKSGTAEAVEILAASTKDEDLGARRAVYIALDWLTASPAAQAALKAKGPQLTAQYEEELPRAHTKIVNEDLKRVVWKVQQL